MTCIELQESLAEIAEIEDGGSAEQRAHLKVCPECSALVQELSLIASSAAALREADEPSPRVWNSIEIVLRREGLIHPPRAGRSLIPSISSRWAWARWFAPVAALLLLAVGIRLHQSDQPRHIALNTAPPAFNAASEAAIAGLNDDDLLQEVATEAPALRAQYLDNLRRANQYIHDARSIVDANPNDEEARRSLLEAYQQKAMLFELAMDRSLP
ncbi:MAG TPA: hypothetical protein VMD99_16590 [Terriglobales bacterium]|nr:hypothetical protein [Terriglobales bacterium]